MPVKGLDEGHHWVVDITQPPEVTAPGIRRPHLLKQRNPGGGSNEAGICPISAWLAIRSELAKQRLSIGLLSICGLSNVARQTPEAIDRLGAFKGSRRATKLVK